MNRELRDMGSAAGSGCGPDGGSDCETAAGSRCGSDGGSDSGSAPVGCRPERGIIGKVVAAAAAAVVTFVTLINSSPAILSAVLGVPVIGRICSAVVFAEYEKTERFDFISVRIPNISGAGNSALERRINSEIQSLINCEAEAAKERAEEYYDAFVMAGGDPAEFIPADISLDYEINCLTDRAVSFTIAKEETLSYADGQILCFNLDLDSGRYLTLADLFGEDFKDEIWGQLEPQLEADENMKKYRFDGVDARLLITNDRMFRLADGGRSAVIIFDKYEIAGGAAGRLEYKVALPGSDWGDGS